MEDRSESAVNDVPAFLHNALGQQYTLANPVGRGGMATVFLAHDTKHDRRVAVKVLHNQVTQSSHAGFLREIGIVARLQHPHILPLLDSGLAGNIPYFIMPYVEGPTLFHHLRDHGSLTITQAVEFAESIADALAHAHRHDVVHLDIKPSNILLSSGHPIITDFGIAQIISGGQHRYGEMALSGTPDYMSPEQAMNHDDIDGRSDIYSLGCLLFEMLTGVQPFASDSPDASLFKQLNHQPPDVTAYRPDAPPHIVDLVSHMLAKVPHARPETMAQVAEELRHTPAMAAARGTRSPRRLHRSRLAVASLCAAVLASLGFITRASQTALEHRGDAVGLPIVDGEQSQSPPNHPVSDFDSSS